MTEGEIHQAIREQLKATPFQPFVLSLADGRIMRIETADQVLLTETSILIGRSRVGKQTFSRVERISLLHVVGIEELTDELTKTLDAKDRDKRDEMLKRLGIDAEPPKI